jgi:hypothetical protein
MFSNREDQRKAILNFLASRAGDDGRLCIKEMSVLLVLQRVNTPDSIWIILHPARSFHISGNTCNLNREKTCGNTDLLKKFFGYRPYFLFAPLR